jgi:hypothetical protein
VKIFLGDQIAYLVSDALTRKATSIEGVAESLSTSNTFWPSARHGELQYLPYLMHTGDFLESSRWVLRMHLAVAPHPATWRLIDPAFQGSPEAAAWTRRVNATARADRCPETARRQGIRPSNCSSHFLNRARVCYVQRCGDSPAEIYLD